MIEESQKEGKKEMEDGENYEKDRKDGRRGQAWGSVGDKEDEPMKFNTK